MKDFIFKTLTFFRIIDPNDQLLSLTNVALMITLGKLVYAPSVNASSIGALFVSLLAYSSKKVINLKAGTGKTDNEQ